MLGLGARLIVWVVEPLMAHQGPQNAQQAVHQRAQCLHPGQRVLGPLQEMLVSAGKGEVANMLVAAPGQTVTGWIKYSIEAVDNG